VTGHGRRSAAWARRALVALASLASTSAGAASWGLQWARGPGAGGCIDGHRVAAAVEARLGRAVFVGPTSAERTVEGVLLKEADGWRAVISVQDREGRTLGSREHHAAGESCASLDEAVTFIIALLIDAETPAAPPAAAAPPDGDQPPEPKVRVLVPKPEPAPPPPEPRARLELDVWPLFGLGKVTLPTPGLRVGAYGALPSGAGLELGVEGWLPVTRNAGPGGVTASAVASELAVCPFALRPGRVLLTACASVLVGALIAQGFGFDLASRSVRPLLDLGGRVRAGWSLTERVELTGGLGLAARVLRPSLVYVDASGATLELLPSSAVTFEAGLGLSIRLW